jgi:nucleoside-diphosphate-sugar epimerase
VTGPLRDAAEGGLSLTGKRVLVTGASGFLGRALLPLLAAEGAVTRCFMRRASVPPDANAETFLGDIADAVRVGEAVQDVDAVVHLAGLASVTDSLRDPVAFFRTNVAGTFNLLEACRTRGVRRLVHISSSQLYAAPQGGPIAEDHLLDAATPYAASKLAAETMVSSYVRSYGLPAVILRPFNIYGPGQSPAALIPTIVTQALAGGDLRLGRTDLTRDLTYVADVAGAIVATLKSAAAVGRKINIGSGRGVRIDAVARMILEQVGSHGAILGDPARLRDHEAATEIVVANVDLAGTLLNWRARTALDEGLRRTIAAYRDDKG